MIMNVLCLFQKFDFSSSTIYLDLVMALKDRGHRVMILSCTSEEKESPFEVRDSISTGYVRVPDQFRSGKIKKGLVQLMLGRKILNGVRKYFWKEKVDIIIYPTPPVTLAGILKPLKDHFNAVNYLMLKDIFPQNAVDLHMMKEGSLIYRLFKGMEEELYEYSDVIGCMSSKNMDHVGVNEGESVLGKLELFPNTVKVLEAEPEEKVFASGDKVSFIFGGNLGKPQAVDHLLKGIELLKDFEEAEFTFIGSGTEENMIRDYIERERPGNLKLLKELPRREYEELLKKADVGIVSLSPDFTIPNYPSRILSYMQMGKPILAVTDKNTDIRELVTEDACCGYWCYSGDEKAFAGTVKKIVSEKELLSSLGRNGRRYLKEYFNVERSVDILENAVEARKK